MSHKLYIIIDNIIIDIIIDKNKYERRGLYECYIILYGF